MIGPWRFHLFAELPQPDRCQFEGFFFGGETVEDIKQACISLYIGFYMVLMVEIGVFIWFFSWYKDTPYMGF